MPQRPHRDALDAAQDGHQAGQPRQQAEVQLIVVGTGLAGASAAATLAELGYNVTCFCYQDSPRRAHSIAAQGGINAAKNYQNDGDSVYRLFYDTVKGGDFRAREANVYRLAEVSVNIIDQCVAQGVPFAREYGGLLANRSFGGAQVPGLKPIIRYPCLSYIRRAKIVARHVQPQESEAPFPQKSLHHFKHKPAKSTVTIGWLTIRNEKR